MKRSRVVLCLATIAAAGVPAAAHAQAFGLNEIGSCATGRLVAVTGAPCDDASTIYWNPAAATTLRGVSVYLGAAAIAVDGGFRADLTNRFYGADVPTSVPPHGFVNWKQSDRLALGLGVYVPYGLTSQWKADFPGRFSAQKAALASIYVQPNIAYDVVPGRLSIGGGPIFGHSTVELKQSIDAISSNPALIGAGIAPGTEIGRARLTGSANGFGAQFGVYAHVTPTFTLGMRYLTAIDFKYDAATARFTQTVTGIRVPLPTGGYALLDTLVAKQFVSGGPLTEQTGKTHIRHPGQLQFGVGFTGITNTTLSVDAGFLQWSSFKELPLSFSGGAPSRTIIEDYKNSYSVRGGIEHRFMPLGIAGRAGFGYTQTPAPDETVTPLLPDMNRYNYGFGIGLPLGARYALDASYLRVDTKGRRGRIVERNSRTQTAESLNSGAYTLAANIVSLSLKAQF
ncbi:MAG TPA: outer membrane protein transport protein [Gemmatimonadaceae bacterium]|nr:outer membrane protein transport protein [Gemmatimonadaceae bacterium]